MYFDKIFVKLQFLESAGFPERLIPVWKKKKTYQDFFFPHNIRFVDTGEMPETFPYRTKALFAFEEIDGVDVCFFGMHVQEYGSECAFPNTR